MIYLQDWELNSDLASGISRAAMLVVIKRGDDDVLRDFVMMADIAGPCVRLHGVDEQELVNVAREPGSTSDWYHVAKYPSIEVCPRCYYVQVKLLGASHFFSPIDRSLVPGMIRMCFFTRSEMPYDISTSDPAAFENTVSWRGRRIANTLDLGYETGD